MIVMKFGGTSVGSADAIRRIRDIVVSQLDQRPVVVVSAVGGVTNLLVDMAKADRREMQEPIDAIYRRHVELISQLWDQPPAELDDYIRRTIDQAVDESSRLDGAERSDRLVSVGEMLSSRIVSRYLSDIHPAQQCLASDLLVSTARFGDAEIIDSVSRQRINDWRRVLESGNYIPVVTGFLAATDDGRVTTLGRGGSDYSAAILGYYLVADEIQIWTDVDGVFTTDPRRNDQARLIEELTYHEASELAAFGAKVLHPKTMRPAVHGQIPLRIGNTFRPEGASTRVVPETTRHAEVVAVVAKQSVMMVNIYAAEMLLGKGFLARISSVFAEHNISIDIISASETSVSLTLDNHEELEAALGELSDFSSVSVNHEVGLVSLIGQSISKRPSLLASICQELVDADVELDMVSVGAQAINISLVLPSDAVEAVTARLHHKFIGEMA